MLVRGSGAIWIIVSVIVCGLHVRIGKSNSMTVSCISVIAASIVVVHDVRNLSDILLGIWIGIACVIMLEVRVGHSRAIWINI